MIKSIKHKGLAKFASTGNASKLPVQNADKVDRVIQALDAATAPENMNIPGFGFHSLKGDRAGTFSITISGNWRLTFAWDQGAIDVDMEDYH